MTEVVRIWIRRKKEEKLRTLKKRRLQGVIPTDQKFNEKLSGINRKMLKMLQQAKKDITDFTRYLLEKAVVEKITEYEDVNGGEDHLERSEPSLLVRDYG